MSGRSISGEQTSLIFHIFSYGCVLFLSVWDEDLGARVLKGSGLAKMALAKITCNELVKNMAI